VSFLSYACSHRRIAEISFMQFDIGVFYEEPAKHLGFLLNGTVLIVNLDDDSHD
jgi:hypothetical protein